MPKKIVYITLMITLTLFACTTPPDRSELNLEGFLFSGQFEKGIDTYKSYLNSTPDNQLFFEQGILRFFYTIRESAREVYNYGLESFFFMDISSFKNPSPAPFSYNIFRQMLDRFYKNLKETEAVLSRVEKSSVKVKLHMASIGMDITGEGKISEKETLGALYRDILFDVDFDLDRQTDDLEAAYFSFDYADVLWLRAYLHFMMHTIDLIQTWDLRIIFDTGLDGRPNYVPSTESELEKFKPYISNDPDIWNSLIFIIQDKERLAQGWNHITTTFSLCRTTWNAVRSETDDDHEWLPSPNQTSPFEDLTVTDEIIDTWIAMMELLDDIFQGRKLLPLFDDSRGLNIYKLYHNPRNITLQMILANFPSFFDPYLDRGEMLDIDRLERLSDPFGNDLWFFAAWFN